MTRIVKMSAPVLGLTSLFATLFCGAAGAHSSGGTSAPARPEIDSMVCTDGGDRSCAHGELLRIDGEHLGAATQVVFLGAAGLGDNRPAAPSESSAHELLVRVPQSAASGPLRVKAAATPASRRSPTVRVAPSAPVQRLEAAGGT